MKKGRRARSNPRRAQRFAATAGVVCAVVLFYALTANGLRDAVFSRVGGDFYGAALALEMSEGGGFSLGKAVAAQSFMLSIDSRTESPLETLEAASPTPSRPPVSHDYSEDDDSDAESDEHISAVESDVNVRTITIKNTDGDGIISYDGVYIKNNTRLDVDVQALLETDIAEMLAGDIEVLVVHTHASEAYYPDGDDVYEPTDVDRTEDTNYNIVSLGDIIADVLNGYGVRVTHLRDIFDYPTYSGSYTRTLAAIERELADNPKIRIVIDVHRDAMITAEGIKYRTVADADGETAAQLMFVMGTGEGGLSHPEWRSNLTLAAHLQKRINDKYEDLCRPLSLSKSRYNQHATSGSMIIEIGTSGNTLQEARVSAEIFARELGMFLSELRGF